VIAIGDNNGYATAVVALGTSQKVDKLFPGEFAIAPADGPAFDLSGLTSPTKFNLARTSELDFNDVWFGVAPNALHGQTPKLGILHPSLVRRAEAAYKAVVRGPRR